MSGIIFTSDHSLISSSEFPGYSIELLNSIDYENIDDWMSNILTAPRGKAINIFIPLSFGTILSEYLGLRFALHIRTTIWENQNSNIFIYGTESLDSVIKNEFSLLARTKGTYLIDYNLNTLQEHAKINQIHLSNRELAVELSKIQVKIPASLYDSHSVANIWGMYRILELEGIDPLTINALNVRKNKLNNIYFKWLRAKNLTNELINEEVTEIKKAYVDKLPGLKIVGKIDVSKIK